MGLLDRLFGRHRQGYDQAGYRQPQYQARGRGGQSSDEQALARYRYLLRTAPPEQIEEAHAEAFAQLTPDQRQQVLAQLAAAVPAGERPRTDDPRTLARVATRASVRGSSVRGRSPEGMAAASWASTCCRWSGVSWAKASACASSICSGGAVRSR